MVILGVLNGLLAYISDIQGWLILLLSLLVCKFSPCPTWGKGSLKVVCYKANKLFCTGLAVLPLPGDSCTCCSPLVILLCSSSGKGEIDTALVGRRQCASLGGRGSWLLPGAGRKQLPFNFLMGAE